MRSERSLSWALCFAARPQRTRFASASISGDCAPAFLLVLSSVADILIISTLAFFVIEMAPLPITIIACELAGTIAFGTILDVVKIPVFARLCIA